jgi:hypothetical protein
MTNSISNERRDGLYLVLIGSLFFILLGLALMRSVPSPLADFKTIYYASKTLLEQRDPFEQSEVMRVYEAQRDSRNSDSAKDRQIATQNIYPPNALFLAMPFAALDSKPAGFLWLMVIFASFITASVLVWDLSADFAPALAGALIGFMLASSELLPMTGNVAGIAVSLSAIAVWCFVRERLVALGIVCLAVSLVFKPHDTGLVWLYFMLAGSVERGRAIKTLLVALALSVPGMVWVWRLSPNWIHEWGLNLAAYSVHGGVNDPGPMSSGGHGFDSLVSLQTIFSVFKDDLHFYNLAAELVCAPLLLGWMYLVLRRRTPSATVSKEVSRAPIVQARVWMALAVAVALTMLPIYHRQLDGALLLLAVPACVALWSRGGTAGRIGLAITSVALVFTGAFGWMIVEGLLHVLHPPATGWGACLSIGLQVFPAPMILLMTGCFYLWAMAREGRGAGAGVEAASRG